MTDDVSCQNNTTKTQLARHIIPTVFFILSTAVVNATQHLYDSFVYYVKEKSGDTEKCVAVATAASFGGKMGRKFYEVVCIMPNVHCARGMCVMKTANQRMIVVYCCYACHLVSAVHYSSIDDRRWLSLFRSVVVSLLTIHAMQQ